MNSIDQVSQITTEKFKEALNSTTATLTDFLTESNKKNPKIITILKRNRQEIDQAVENFRKLSKGLLENTLASQNESTLA